MPIALPAALLENTGLENEAMFRAMSRVSSTLRSGTFFGGAGLFGSALIATTPQMQATILTTVNNVASTRGVLRLVLTEAGRGICVCSSDMISAL